MTTSAMPASALPTSAIPPAPSATAREDAGIASDAPDRVVHRLPARTAATAWPAMAGALAVVPLLLTEITTFRIGLILINGITVTGLHVLVGWSRQITLGHAGLVAVPAFVAARMAGGADLPLAVVLPVAIAIGAALGALVGAAALRVSGLQVALVTLLFGVAIDRFALNLPWMLEATTVTAPAIQLGPLPLYTNRALYPLLLLIFLAAVGITRALERSSVARGLKMVGSSRGLAESAGIPAGRYATFAYAYAGALAGTAGAMYVYWVSRVGTDAFGLTTSLLVLTIVVVGGPGSLAGPLVATALFVSRDLPAWLPAVSLIVVAVAYPGGLNAVGRTLYGRWAHRLAARRGGSA